jgi:UDP-N-acetylmuramoyl-L-alanyl-D-glutamate--2,6-diaminopimelate ligase
MGCGGDRDKGKRPLMGEISMRLADVTIVTDDNPRSEDPATIRAEILNAAPGASEVGDRAQAIKDTTVKLGQGDVLVIAGKGHEQGQIFKDHTAPFDDVEQARGVIQTLIKTSNGKLED